MPHGDWFQAVNAGLSVSSHHARNLVGVEFCGVRTTALSSPVADHALDSAIHPWFQRALFALEELRDEVSDDSTIADDVDLAPVRAALADLAGARRSVD